MERLSEFSEKALQALGGYYVYALIDPRTDKVFYIGKGTGNRVFSHEIESDKSPDSEKEKLRIISSIEKEGLSVKRVIINYKLTESEAFVAETSLINLLNFTSEIKLSNIVAGHDVHEALTVEDFELRHGAEHLKKDDIKHSILVIKINKLFRWGMTPEELYNTTRGFWGVSLESIKKRKVEYVFAVYNQLIVGVYKPSEWHYVYEKIDLPRPEELVGEYYEKMKDRKYFIDRDYATTNEIKEYYLHKSIVELDNKSNQYPTTYLSPDKKIDPPPITHRGKADMTDIYEEPTFDYVILKTTEERLSKMGSLYEATRLAWKIGKKIENYKYVLSVINKVVRGVFVVERWKLIESGNYAGRYEFFGKEADKTLSNGMLGKTIPFEYRKPGMASPVVFKKH